MSDLATVLTAAGVSLPTIGGGAAFLWNKVEKRFVKLEREVDRCRAREANEVRRGSVYLTVIELLWQEVQRLSLPGTNPTLVRAKKLLDGLKTDLPAEDPILTALALKLDGE